MLTLETAKKLKEVGWSKETEWIWYNVNPTKNQWVKILYDMLEDYVNEFIWSPSLEELLVEMPNRIYYNDTEAYFILVKIADKCYEAKYKGANGIVDYNSRLVVDPTEAVAQLYLKLRQEGLIE